MTDSFAPLSFDSVCRVEFGPGRIELLPELIADTGRHRAFVVTDRGLRAAGVAERVLKNLDVTGVEYAVYDEGAPNPSTGNVDAGAARARAFGPAVVVALGGGSVLDAAKGISLLVGNPDAVAADADHLWEAADGLPLIAVPTTSGTGAETNGVGVIEDAGPAAKCTRAPIRQAPHRPARPGADARLPQASTRSCTASSRWPRAAPTRSPWRTPARPWP
ncbi:iron-containing alcohol dehydrogenase [Streptomyces sp. NPDC001118]